MMFSNTRTVEIEFGDCDPAGIVYFPNYFRFFDDSTAHLISAALGMKKRDWTVANGSMAARGSTMLPGLMGLPGSTTPPGLMAPDALRAMQTLPGLPPWATGAFAPIR